MRIDFTQENKGKSADRFDKLTLKKDERARVCLLEIPELFYTHNIAMPVVDPTTGEVVQRVEKNSKGEEYEKDATEWVATARCSGNVETVRDKEIDPENCVYCKAVQDHPSKFTKPEAKYASLCIKYKTAHGTTQPQTPFQVELLLWVLSQYKFDKIVDIAKEFGNPLAIDLNLGPCMSGTFQNYEIQAAAGGAYWAQDQSFISHVQQLVQANRPTPEQVADTVAFGITPTRASADIEKVLQRHAMIGRPTAAAVPTEFGVVNPGGTVMPQPTWDAPQGGVPSFAQPPAFAPQAPQAAPPAEQVAPQAAPQAPPAFAPQVPQAPAPAFAPQVPQAAPPAEQPPAFAPQVALPLATDEEVHAGTDAPGPIQPAFAPQVPQAAPPAAQPPAFAPQVPQAAPQAPPAFAPQVPQAAPPTEQPPAQPAQEQQPPAQPAQAVPDFAALLQQVQQ